MNYIALTIGPIYKTLVNAKKPKELFSSSYIFSYIMKNIIYRFKDREFVIPYIKDSTIFEDKDIGLFHDRFIFVSQSGDLKRLDSVIDEVLSDIAKNLNLSLDSIKDYLQIHYFEKSLDDSMNPILELTPYLDTQELLFQTSQDMSFAETLRRKKGDKDNFLTEGKGIVDDLKQLSYHNYYCIIHADGDKMGEMIQSKDSIQDVSKALFEYCINSNELIKKFGGQTIFAGGDDLLFFAPVIGRDKTTIFNLCEDISNDFKSKVGGVATLSFGITINYVKFPLYEAVENSRTQLFAKAKNDKRNNIAFQVTKHSGQSFEAIVHKGDREIYKRFLAFVSQIDSESQDKNFLHSIHHKIDTYKVVIDSIKNDRDKLQNFFDNYFNEYGHSEYEEFFETLVDFIYHTQDLELVYATLRFIKFVKGDKQ
jgi:CRISPR-associated protein Cmr2